MPETSGSGPTRRLDISYPTSEFIKLAKMWEPFDATTMGIIVRYIKSAALPDYVFEGLEKPPPASRALKRPNAVRRLSASLLSPQTPSANGNATGTLQDEGSGAGQPFKKARTASAFVSELLPGGSTPAPTTPATEAATALQCLNTASGTPTPSPAPAAQPAAAQA